MFLEKTIRRVTKKGSEGKGKGEEGGTNKQTSFIQNRTRKKEQRSDGQKQRENRRTTDWFQIGKGVRQGCILFTLLI